MGTPKHHESLAHLLQIQSSRRTWLAEPGSMAIPSLRLSEAEGGKSSWLPRLYTPNNCPNLEMGLSLGSQKMTPVKLTLLSLGQSVSRASNNWTWLIFLSLTPAAGRKTYPPPSLGVLFHGTYRTSQWHWMIFFVRLWLVFPRRYVLLEVGFSWAASVFQLSPALSTGLPQASRLTHVCVPRGCAPRPLSMCSWKCATFIWLDQISSKSDLFISAHRRQLPQRPWTKPQEERL